MIERVIFHIDVNSAYLSWEATYRLQHGESLDIRLIPAVICGNQKDRHGIILAKSIPTKKYNIVTGEPVHSALKKCPDLNISSPNYILYMKCSNAMIDIINRFSPCIQRYSIDECFVDVTNSPYCANTSSINSYIDLAHIIKNTIYSELGFTVNIGVSTNKLLAKIASDFTKPNNVHTLFHEEIEHKLWSLPIEDLFMVGRATAPKLKNLNINTIGDLAKYDLSILQNKLKSFGTMLWNYSNGIENSEVRNIREVNFKGIGNSITLSFNAITKKEIHNVILSLCETISFRLRKHKCFTSLISVSVKNTSFISYSHQKNLITPTDCTNIIYSTALDLVTDLWRGEPIRQIGISISKLSSNNIIQSTLLDDNYIEKNRKIDSAIDSIRETFGKSSIKRGVFIASPISSMSGGVIEDEYPMMSSLL